jgi:hypothetical protein
MFYAALFPTRRLGLLTHQAKADWADFPSKYGWHIVVVASGIGRIEVDGAPLL